MKNIFLFDCRQSRAPSPTKESITSYIQDGNGLLTADHNQSKVYMFCDGKVFELFPEEERLGEILNVELQYEGLDYKPVSVGLCYLIDMECVCLALNNGDVFNIPTSGGDVEQLLALQQEIDLMEWSPDQGVALLASSKSIYVMTANFDLMNEIDLNQGGFGENEFINIGWGKKETQFHGSAGKAAAKAQLIQSSCQTPPAEHDSDRPRISWRGDGEMFAVNYLLGDAKTRSIRIFGRQGQLLCTSEIIPGLEANVSWRPSGSLIACTQRLPNKYVVCSVEKNGLRHGDFTLPFPVDCARVRLVQFNSESTLLALWCQPAQDDVNLPKLSVGQSSLLIYTTGNYHWYLKQRFDFDIGRGPIAVVWDQVNGNLLHVWCFGGQYYSYNFSHRIDSSRGLDSQDKATVAVIDGDKLQLTAFRHSVIPPPMCDTSVDLPSAALEVMFGPCFDHRSRNDAISMGSKDLMGSHSNDLCVFMSNGDVAALSYVQDRSNSSPSHVCIGSLPVKWNDETESLPSQHLHHWAWISSDKLVCSAMDGSSSFLCVLDLIIGQTSHSENFIIVREKIPLEERVVGIVPGLYGSCIIQYSNQQTFRYCVSSGGLTLHTVLPQPCTIMKTCLVAESSGKMREVLLSLSVHHCLYLDNKQIMSVVTSLAVHTHFLLLSTTHHKLLSCPLIESALLGLPKDGVNAVGNGISSRRLEQGSRIIVAVPESNRVILQMPRGNLECIEPRALSLHQMALLLDTGAYYAAFDLARKQRINLNLFVDHNPSKFIQDIGAFIENVSNPQWLGLFFAELHEEDCTTTMYTDHYKQPREKILEQKVYTVCDTFITTINRLKPDSSSVILPVLSALVRKGTENDLQAALTLVKEQKLKDEKSRNQRHAWKDALRHLLYMKDVDQLMDVALGMYDFDLVILVASLSNKDPKEYLAFLNTLRTMETNYQRFSIDKHLRKWESALAHLTLCEGEESAEELMSYIRERKLFKTALCLLPLEDKRHQTVAQMYGEYLMTQRHYEEAGIMFARGTDFKSALQAHTRALAWVDCIQDARVLGYSEKEMEELLLELCSALQDVHKYKDCATILIDYLNKPAEAIDVLCAGRAWEEAIRVAHLKSQQGLIEARVHPALTENAQSMIVQVNSSKDDFEKHSIRLTSVRVKKQQAREKLNTEDGDCDGHGESDLFSDTSSVTTGSLSSTKSSSGRSTTSSQRSSKNRRKLERKILNLKEGSPHEELALMHALHQVITSTFALREDTRLLCCALLKFGDYITAANLQQLLAQTLKHMESSLKMIWPPMPDLVASEASQNMYGPHTTSNMLAASSHQTNATVIEDIHLLEPQFRFPPVILPVSWELDIFKK